VAESHHDVREDFRPLTAREREILELLLSAELPGIGELREQVAYVRAARWNCRCASFDVVVDRERARRSSITASPAVEANSKERDDPNTSFDLLLWVEDGWLAGVEIADYVDQHGDDSPNEIPPPEYWHQPQPYKAPG
jgi:predicted nicotinamide N-methyase